MAYTHFDKPIRIGAIKLKNRIVRSCRLMNVDSNGAKRNQRRRLGSFRHLGLLDNEAFLVMKTTYFP